MMRAKKLWGPPFYTLLLRHRSISSSAACRVPPGIGCSIISFSSSLNKGRFHFPENPFLKFSGKNFSADSSGKVGDRCWNCRAEPVPFLVCSSCRAIQPVDPSINYFQIFGLEKKYEIEGVNLEGKYKDWQKKLHPDLVHSKSEKEREFASEQSARVIDAYRTLSDPLSRAIYILRLEGVDVNEEETIAEPGLLAEILEIREAVDEASDVKALNDIKSQVWLYRLVRMT
uniref:J domain-containing protein n=1 Tax=Rhizophora mucronata TaxID=61149 RepID=A0A2P2JUB4_RHIMU